MCAFLFSYFLTVPMLTTSVPLFAWSMLQSKKKLLDLLFISLSLPHSSYLVCALFLLTFCLLFPTLLSEMQFPIPVLDLSSQTLLSLEVFSHKSVICSKVVPRLHSQENLLGGVPDPVELPPPCNLPDLVTGVFLLPAEDRALMAGFFVGAQVLMGFVVYEFLKFVVSNVFILVECFKLLIVGHFGAPQG